MKMCAQDIAFTLIRSERKAANIVIVCSGDVIVRAPVGVDDERVREVVADRALWVHRSLAEWEDLNSSRRHCPLVQGDLRFRDHSDAFWNEVDIVLPRYRERKGWLRTNGAALDI
jgi:predicted metal-dependent hydrolase